MDRVGASGGVSHWFRSIISCGLISPAVFFKRTLTSKVRGLAWSFIVVARARLGGGSI